MAEDYVEAILDLIDEDGHAKLTEIAWRLGIAHPTNPNKRITASFGVASGIAMPEADPKQLLKAADLALYEAKRAGRNRTCLAQATETLDA